MKYRWFISGLSFLSLSCGSPTQFLPQEAISTPTPMETVTPTTQGNILSLAVTTQASLPTCTPERKGALAYVKEEKNFYTCNVTWAEIEITPYSVGVAAWDEVAGKNCSAGGKKYVFFEDLNSNNVQDEGEIVITTSYICNGLQGETGAKGDTGVAGPTGATGATGPKGDPGTAGSTASATRIASSISCSGDLSTINAAGRTLNGQIVPAWVSVRYNAAVYSSGDVLASFQVYGNFIGITNSAFYSASQVGSLVAPVILTYDVLGAANYGFWIAKVNRDTGVATVRYTDDDFGIPSYIEWNFLPSACTINNY